MYLENRLIAMLDILGFASKIDTKEKLLEITNEYSEIIETVKKEDLSNEGTKGRIENFEVGEFVFDNLIFVSKPLDVHASCFHFIASLERIMQKFFELEYPLRGSIGLGDYSANKNIFLSNIFKKLNKFEIKQQWSGCMLLPDIEELVLKKISGNSYMNENEKSSYLHKYNIPLKENDFHQGVCINWSYNIKKEILNSKLNYLKGDIDKYEHTKKYIEYCDSLVEPIQKIPQQDGTVLTMKIRKTISGFNIIFEDEYGNPKDPSGEIQLAVYDGKS